MGKVDFIDTLSGEEIKLLEDGLLTLEEQLPSMFMGLNVAQYRAFKKAYTRRPGNVSGLGLLPDMASVEYANGVGKSHMLILDMIGWTMGPDYLNWKAYPEEAIEYWYGLGGIRDKGLLSLRLVCMSDDMKAGGSVYELLREIFPYAKPTAMDNGKCFRQIDVFHPTEQLVKNSISIKTFDQDEVKHSGSTCNRIWINEPLPDNLIGETIGRIRSKEGRPDGSIMMCATILDHAGWINELEDSKSFCVVRCKGHLYENCIGSEVTAEMAAEVLEEIGVVLKPSEDGVGYQTNGVLKRQKIMAMVDGWARTKPHQLQARKSGRPISGGGKIYPTFNPEIHVVKSDVYENIPDSFPVIQVADPHGSRPCATIWAVVLPSDRLVVVDEWPSVDGHGYYETIDEKRYFVEQTCEIWRRIEADRNYTKKIVRRVGDPNRFRDPNPHNMQTLHFLYAEQGFDFWIEVNDSIDVGHEEVSRYLHYNTAIAEVNPNDPAAWPRILVCDRCVNTKRALQNYAYKMHRDKSKPVSEGINEKFKDFADVVRYLVMWHKTNPFSESRVDVKRLDDVAKLKLSRLPRDKRVFGNYGFNAKGRKLVGKY
jgi:hypothetical protein